MRLDKDGHSSVWVGLDPTHPNSNFKVRSSLDSTLMGGNGDGGDDNGSKS